MNLSDHVRVYYLELPRKTREPVKISRVLEQRLRRHRQIRDRRLAQLKNED